MPITSGSAGGVTGMNLKAWVIFSGAGVVVKSLNVTSVVRNSAGNYSVVFTAAMSGTSFMSRMTALDSGNLAGMSSSAKTAAGVTLQMTISGSAVDVAALVEFYE